jgi:hypothetical protein
MEERIDAVQYHLVTWKPRPAPPGHPFASGPISPVNAQALANTVRLSSTAFAVALTCKSIV